MFIYYSISVFVLFWGDILLEYLTPGSRSSRESFVTLSAAIPTLLFYKASKWEIHT
jgi:hypothetical protein